RSDLGPQRVLILRLVFVECGPILASFLPVEVKSSRVVTKRALRARDEVDAVVRARAGHGVLEYNGAPLGRLDEARVHVAALVGFFPFGVAVGNMVVAISGQALVR